MVDSFDKSSTLNIDGEVLNRSSFAKTLLNKLARRTLSIIQGSSGHEANVGANGGLDVNVQDQTTPAFDVFFTKELSRTVLTANTAVNDYNVILPTGHGFATGDRITLFDTTNSKIFLAEVIIAGVNNVEVDTPIDYTFTVANTIVVRGSHELNVDGSATRQIFTVQPYLGVSVDVTRIILKIICENPPQFDLFGDLSQLLRGVVIRKANGNYVNYFNVKTNGELANLMYDVTFYDQSKPQGINGIVGRLTYGGQSKHGVTIRLTPDERLELIVQDDLSGLVSFKVIASGHIVE